MANHAPKGPLLRAAGVAGLRVAFLRLPMGVYRYKLTFAKNLCVAVVLTALWTSFWRAAAMDLNKENIPTRNFVIRHCQWHVTTLARRVVWRSSK